LTEKIDSKRRRVLLTGIIFIVSVIFSLFIAEGACRLILGSISKTVPDDILENRILPHTGGHDAWGFRNETVPDKADIVIIGDSQTYGLNVLAEDSWPSTLEKLLERSVYNLSLGGYGPVQYSYLLEHKAFKLDPSLIIVGFYFGNDLVDVFDIVYGNDNWKHLRNSEISLKPVRRRTNKGMAIFFDSLKNWLWQNSRLYQLLVNFSAAAKERIRYYSIKYNIKKSSGITYFKDAEHHIDTGFNPGWRYTTLNLNDSRIEEGLRITLELFKRMNDACSEKGVDFIIVFIPTKESVYAEYIENNRELMNSRMIDELLANERRIGTIMKEYFLEHNIEYLEVLDKLREEARKGQIYPRDSDDHFNRDGYEAVARAVKGYLSTAEEGCY